MSIAPPLAIAIPLAAAVACLALGRSVRLQWGVSLLSMLALVVLGTSFLWRTLHGEPILVAALGGLPPAFGIVFVVDVLAAVMVCVTAVVSLLVVVFVVGNDAPVLRHRFFHPLLHVLVMGVMGAYLTGDLFDLYVWFEVLLIASFVLLGLGGGRDQLEGALKYVVLNLFGSILFLIAAGIVYGVTGTLNMAQLHVVLPELEPGLRLGIAVLLFVAFGIKAAVFPLFFWLPASYHTAHPAVGALFSGLLTKVGVVALVRLQTLLFPSFVADTGPLVAWVAGLTMVGGVMGAFAQTGIRRILSFHIISQVGFLVLALAIGTPLALAGLVFYMVHNILAKTDLFLIGGIVLGRMGSDHLAKAGGLWWSAPVLGLLFLVPALSLAGLPPLSGFWAKVFVVKATLDDGHLLLAAAALVTGLLTLLSMLKIWNEAFWVTFGDEAPTERVRGEAVQTAVVAAFALFMVLLGLFPAQGFAVAEAAASQLADPAGYVDAVLGGAP